MAQRLSLKQRFPYFTPLPDLLKFPNLEVLLLVFMSASVMKARAAPHSVRSAPSLTQLGSDIPLTRSHTAPTPLPPHISLRRARPSSEGSSQTR